jgi:hypothetical protein
VQGCGDGFNQVGLSNIGGVGGCSHGLSRMRAVDEFDGVCKWGVLKLAVKFNQVSQLNADYLV